MDSTFLAPWSPRLLSVLRIVSGLLFMQHGTSKFFGFPYVEMLANVPVFYLVGIAGLLELIGGALLVVGLFTRPVAFILSGMMAVAYFMAHVAQSFFPLVNQGELAILYCFVFLYFAAAGPGPWSVDAMMRRAPERPAY